MLSRSKRTALCVLLAVLVAAGVWFLRLPRPAQLTPEDRAALSARTVLIAGETYGILRGDAYRQLRGGDEWTFVDHLFVPDYIEACAFEAIRAELDRHEKAQKAQKSLVG
jgi:hypothetical protein